MGERISAVPDVCLTRVDGRSGSTQIPSPRESPLARSKRVKAAGGPLRGMTGIRSMWKKPDIAASGELWNSFSLRGTVGGIDQKLDDKSFYAGMKLYRDGEIKAAIDIWEGTRMMLLTRSSPKAIARTMAVPLPAPFCDAWTLTLRWIRCRWCVAT